MHKVILAVGGVVSWVEIGSYCESAVGAAGGAISGCDGVVGFPVFISGCRCHVVIHVPESGIVIVAAETATAFAAT